MFERGWDLLDYVRQVRPWPQLDRLLARLPRHSRYRAALDSDEEFALAVAQLSDEDGPVSVPLVGYSEVALRLDNVFDAINGVTETLIAVHSGKRTPIPNRATRPQTAHERVRRQLAMSRLDDIEQQMTGGR